MDSATRNEINNVLKLPHGELVDLVDAEPIVWSGSDKSGPYQAELVCSWDDERIETVRVSCFVNYTDRPWWRRFGDKTVYDALIGPKDKRVLL